MKKAITTYPNNSNKKFNENKFKKQLDSFNDWEKKKKEHIKRLETELREKELNTLKSPQVNTEANLKFNLNPKNYSAVERLYTQDLMKREEKKMALTKIYTPTFRPRLYTNKYNLGKILQQNNTKVDKKIRIIKKKKRVDDYDDDEEQEEDEDNYENKRFKTLKNYNEREREDDDEDESDEDKYNTKKKNKKGRKNLSVQKKKIKKKPKISESEESDEEESDGNKIINNTKKIDGAKVEIKLRDLLFKNRKPLVRKNNSVGKRKKY